MRIRSILQVACGTGLTLFAMGAQALLCDIVVDRTGMVDHRQLGECRRHRREHAPVRRRDWRDGRQRETWRERQYLRGANAADPHQRLRPILLNRAYVASARADATVRALVRTRI